MAGSVQERFEALVLHGERHEAPEYFQQLSKQFAGGLWHDYQRLLEGLPGPLRGLDVVDLGCKYGHMLVYFLAAGARSGVGVDVEPDYVEAGNRVLGSFDESLSLVQSQGGWLPLPPESADLVFVNEVISHVNPTFLDTLYAEVARVLRPGGWVLVSDGNNLASLSCRKALLDVYDAWENGPPGRQTDRDVVTRPFVEIRHALLADWLPELPAERLEHLARNTSGLFGEELRAVGERYAKTGQLVERPYRRGQCPTNPLPAGVVMERGFYPEQVVLALRALGFDARELTERIRERRPGWRNRLRDALGTLRHEARRRLGGDPGWNFRVLGVRSR